MTHVAWPAGISNFFLFQISNCSVLYLAVSILFWFLSPLFPLILFYSHLFRTGQLPLTIFYHPFSACTYAICVIQSFGPNPVFFPTLFLLYRVKHSCFITLPSSDERSSIWNILFLSPQMLPELQSICIIFCRSYGKMQICVHWFKCHLNVWQRQRGKKTNKNLARSLLYVAR